MSIFRRAVRRGALLLVGMLLLIGLIKAGPSVWRFVYPLQHRDIIAREAKAQRLDPSLVAAVINVESRWNAKAVSPKGATGLMQLMPDTADWVASKSGTQLLKQPDLLQPEVSIRLGTWYLADLLRQFDHNLAKALAAYNGGPGNVLTWLQNGTWDGTIDNADKIPFAETRKYVIKVLNQQKVYDRLYTWAKGS